MRIAVTHEDGQIFQHFGHCESFKIYEVEDGKVVSSEVIDSNGSGHGALAGMLAKNLVNVVICGGIGGGAINALEEAGVEVCSGAQGSCDAAVEMYLDGILTNAGQTCDHHDHEEEGGGCASGGCGGCHGGCGGGAMEPQIIFEGPNAGKKVKAHYKGTFNDGTVFDSSYDRGEPLEFTAGVGMMIKGFDKEVVNMEVGEIRNIHLMPADAYGEKDPDAIMTFAIADLPGAEDIPVGVQVYLTNQYGQPLPVTVVAKDEISITLDANHEMAGKELNFQIELVEVQ